MINLKKLKLIAPVSLGNATGRFYLYSDSFPEDSFPDEELARYGWERNKLIDVENIRPTPDDWCALVFAKYPDMLFVSIQKGSFGKEDMRKILLHLGFDKNKPVEMKIGSSARVFIQRKRPQPYR